MVSPITFADKPKQEPSFDAKSAMKKEMMPIQRINMPKVTMYHLAHFGSAQFGIVYLRQRKHAHAHGYSIRGSRIKDALTRLLRKKVSTNRSLNTLTRT